MFLVYTEEATLLFQLTIQSALPGSAHLSFDVHETLYDMISADQHKIHWVVANQPSC